ncbi:MAG: cell wall hydrolase [Sphingobium sp.]
MKILLFLSIAALAAIIATVVGVSRERAGGAPDPSILVPAAGTLPESKDFSATTLMPVEHDAAQQINGDIPFASAPNPAARPFSSQGGNLDRLRAVECLTATVYYEAASESVEGQRAVAQVVLNRVRHPAFPSSVCGVVFQGSERETGCQFTFTCDGSLLRTPSKEGWARARGIALSALGGYVYPAVGWATHYHADYVVPTWARQLDKISQVGVHIFYHWRGGWGLPGAFRTRYAGREDMDLYSAQAKVRLSASDEAQDAPQDMPQQVAAVPVITGSIRDVGSDSLPARGVPLVEMRRWGIRQDDRGGAAQAAAAAPGKQGEGPGRRQAAPENIPPKPDTISSKEEAAPPK